MRFTCRLKPTQKCLQWIKPPPTLLKPTAIHGWHFFKHVPSSSIRLVSGALWGQVDALSSLSCSAGCSSHFWSRRKWSRTPCLAEGSMWFGCVDATVCMRELDLQKKPVCIFCVNCHPGFRIFLEDNALVASKIWCYISECKHNYARTVYDFISTFSF